MAALPFWPHPVGLQAPSHAKVCGSSSFPAFPVELSRSGNSLGHVFLAVLPGPGQKVVHSYVVPPLVCLENDASTLL